MTPLTLLLSSCLVLVFTHCAHAFTVDDTETRDMDFYPPSIVRDRRDGPDPDDAAYSSWQAPMSKDTLQKRAPSVSINQDLVSLASMLRNEAGRRRIQAASSFLNRLGKRSQPELFESLQGIPSPQVKRAAPDTGRLDTPDVFHRSTRRISVNVPLDALSQMIRTERRRKFDARMANIHSKFLDIGK